MKIQLISDFPLVSNYNAVLADTVAKVNAEQRTKIQEAELVESYDELDHDAPVLLLGPRPAWLPPAYPTINAPSIRATLGTAGGVTKLRWALSAAAQGRMEVQGADYEWQTYLPNVELSIPTWALMAVDIEVSGDIRTDEPEDTELLSVAVCWERADNWISGVVWNKRQLQDDQARSILAQVLSCNQLLTHNGKFDLRWLNKHLEEYLLAPLYPAQDSMLLHHALYPGAGEHGLKPLAHRILGAADWESDLSTYTKGSKAHYERIPQDVLVKYNAFDVYWTLKLYNRLLELADDTALRLYTEHTMPASHMLQDVEAYGMKVDLEYAKELDDNLSQQIETHRSYLTEYVANPNSIPQVKKCIEERFGIKLVSADKASLFNSLQTVDRKYQGRPEYVDLLGEYRSFIDNLLSLRSAVKARSTYVTSIVAKVRNGRVHPTFLVHGTSTGRLSSSGPNVQNVSNDEEGKMSLRRMYVADDGMMLVGADYSQAELRTMAELSDDELMIADLQEDAPDFFDNMLPSVFPEVDFTELDKTHRKPYRLKLKRVVYGCVPYSTRILTRRGWLTHDEVIPNEDETIGYNMQTGLAEWTKITSVNYYGQQPVGRLGHARWGFDVTPGHRWVVKGRNHPVHLRTTDALNTETDIIVAAELSKHIVEQPKFTLDEMRVLSWILSDGYLSIRPFTGRTAQGRSGERRKVIASIQQAKPEYVTEIQALLARLSMDTCVDSIRSGVNYDVAHDWRLPTEGIRDILRRAGLMDRATVGNDLDIDTELVPWLLSLPREYIDVYLDIFCKAEGHKRPDGNWVITQNPGGKLDACEVAAVINGYRVSRTKHGDKCLRLNLLSVPHVTNQVSSYEPDRLEEVWCPTTALGSWTAQQADGRIALTGNSSYGLTAPSISYMLTLEGTPTSQAEAQAIQDAYLNRYPGLRKWRDDTMPLVLSGDELITPFGRRFQQDVVTASTAQRVQNQAWAFRPQSIASDICLRAAMMVHERFTTDYRYSDCHIIASVHDAIYCEAPESLAEAVSIIVQDYMRKSGAMTFKRIPFLTDAHVSKFWNLC